MTDGPQPGSEEPHGRESSELLLRWQRDGDRSALDELLREEIAALKRRLRSGRWPVDRTASVSDVAQDAAYRMLRVETAPRFPNVQALRSYLWRTAWNLLLNRLRERSSQGTRVADSSGPGLDRLAASTGGLGTVESREQSTVMSLAIELLSASDRAILRLVYFEERGIRGAAEALGITDGAANTRLVRARARLAQKLRAWADVIG